jgi:putative ABC transport system permease protein
MVTPGYFPALNLKIGAGRPFDTRDHPDAPRVVMVSETLANRLWPGQSAIGQHLVVDYSTVGMYPYEVVGVVGDIRFRGPRSEPRPEIYLPHAQRSYLIRHVAIRTDEDPRALIPAVRAALRDIDPQKPAYGLRLLGGGALLGLLAAWPLTGVVASLLYGVQPTGPITVVSVVAVRFMVGSIAMCLPSWRATKADPVAVLRRG